MNCISKGMAEYMGKILDDYYCFYNWNYITPHPLSNETHFYATHSINYYKVIELAGNKRKLGEMYEKIQRPYPKWGDANEKTS